MPRCAIIARCGACSVAPAHMTMRSMSLPDSAAVASVTSFSSPSRHTVTFTSGLSATASSTSRNFVTTLSSMASRMSPCFSRPTAGDPPTRRTMDNTWRWFGLASSNLRSQASGKPEAARGGQRLRHELGFERVQRLFRLHAPEHVRHDADGHAAVFLLQLAAALPGEARPQADDRAVGVGEHAVEVRRAVHELDGFEIAFAELHGARQRQLDRRQRRHLRGARIELAVRRPCRRPTASRPARCCGLTTWRCAPACCR